MNVQITSQEEPGDPHPPIEETYEPLEDEPEPTYRDDSPVYEDDPPPPAHGADEEHTDNLLDED